VIIRRCFIIKSEGGQRWVDRGVGAGWEPYDNDDVDGWYDVDPQFYQCLIGEEEYEVSMIGDKISIYAELQEV